MKIIIRNRNKQIQVSNITSKEEMVWIAPELFAEITKDASVAATEFMKKYPQIHEVKFSVLPQMDEEESEEEFYAGEDDNNQSAEQKDGKRQITIRNYDKLKEDWYMLQDIKSLLTTDEIYNELAEYCDQGDGTIFGFSVCHDGDESRRGFAFRQVSYTDNKAEYEYVGLDKF